MIHSSYKINNKVLDLTSPKIMGILNITPDSFSDGGKYINIDNALAYALKMINDGADIIDVGGESTRPGSDPVSVDEEIKRTIPLIKRLSELRKNIIISIDTTKSEVAEQALQNGADIINDISGLTFDDKIIGVAKKYKAAVIIMHIKGNPKTMQVNPHYDDVLKEVYNFLKIQSNKALNNGVEKIILDPGIGFGKSVDDNFSLIKNLGKFESLGYPLLIGLSRKSFIGKTLDLNVEERDVATVILETISVLRSAKIIRTHNVKYCRQMVKLVNKII